MIMGYCKAPDSNGVVRNTPHMEETCKYCGYPGNFEISEISAKTPYSDIEWCPACNGSGEVRAGINWRDKYGELRVRPNPFSSDSVLDVNLVVPLWSICICGICKGTGMNWDGSRSIS